MKVSIEIKDLRTGKTFIKTFDTEFERDKYLRRARYFKNLVIVSKVDTWSTK